MGGTNPTAVSMNWEGIFHQPVAMGGLKGP